jgi:hypothetical protein
LRLLLSSPNLGAMRCLLLHGNRSGNALYGATVQGADYHV